MRAVRVSSVEVLCAKGSEQQEICVHEILRFGNVALKPGP